MSPGHHTVALARKNPQELVIGSAYKLSLDVNLNRAGYLVKASDEDIFELMSENFEVNSRYFHVHFVADEDFFLTCIFYISKTLDLTSTSTMFSK